MIDDWYTRLPNRQNNLISDFNYNDKFLDKFEIIFLLQKILHVSLGI